MVPWLEEHAVQEACGKRFAAPIVFQKACTIWGATLPGSGRAAGLKGDHCGGCCSLGGGTRLLALEKALDVVHWSWLPLFHPYNLCCLHGARAMLLPLAVGVGVAAAQDSDKSTLCDPAGRRVCKCRLTLAWCTVDLDLPSWGGIHPSSWCLSRY